MLLSSPPLRGLSIMKSPAMAPCGPLPICSAKARRRIFWKRPWRRKRKLTNCSAGLLRKSTCRFRKDEMGMQNEPPPCRVVKHAQQRDKKEQFAGRGSSFLVALPRHYSNPLLLQELQFEITESPGSYLSLCRSRLSTTWKKRITHLNGGP